MTGAVSVATSSPTPATASLATPRCSCVDQCEIQVDRRADWVLLAIDTTPNYTENTTPMPATPTKWKYRDIHCVGDQQVGLWSNAVEIMVGKEE